MARVEGTLTNLTGPMPRARRIVSIAPSNTEILHALGLGRRIVGVDKWSDYPPRVRSLVNVGSDLHVDVDAVSALDPDLVVASLHVPGMEDNIPRLEAAGLRYLAVGGVGLEGIWQDLLLIGQYTGRLARAEALVERTRRRMDAIKRVYGSLEAKPSVHWEWAGRPVVAARRSWVTEMIGMAGGRNAYDDLVVESARVSMDEAIQRQPEVVVACWCGARKLPTVVRIASRPGWQNTPAVRQGRVAVFAEDLFGRPGPRLADGLEKLARLIHPEIAPP